MTCQEAQAGIIQFIEHQMSREDTIPFIDHVTSCSECMDELEIYYIMVSAMKELDEGSALTGDFKQALLNELDERYEEIELENERSNLVLIGIFLLMLVAFAAFFIWFLFY